MYGGLLAVKILNQYGNDSAYALPQIDLATNGPDTPSNVWSGIRVHSSRNTELRANKVKRGFLKRPVCGFALLLMSSFLLSAQNPGNLPAQIGPTITAAPLSVSEKFDYRIVQSFGLRGFVGPALGAMIGQANNAPHEWGQGVGGFAQRYASGFGGNLGRQSMQFVLETALHEDPRYFPSKEKSFQARIKNVLLQTLVAQTDSGGHHLAYARIISSFADAQLINAWQPASTGSVQDGVIRGFIGLGSDLGYNFLQEFFPFVRPRSLRHH